MLIIEALKCQKSPKNGKKESDTAFRVPFLKKNLESDISSDNIYTDASEKTSEKISELMSKNKNITIKELSRISV